MTAPADLELDDPDLEEPGGWWARSPGWAQGVIVAGLVIVLLLVGAVGGILATRSTTPTYGPAPGSIDVAFLQDMAVHHQQAVQMAVWERTNTADPALRQLAFDIESSQTSQIGSMQGWLALWEQPLSPPDGQYMGWMGTPVPSMPGMATPDDLARFRATTGPMMDTVFLQLMLRHHRGGLPMAQLAAAQASVPAVRQISTSMVASQTAEADTMTSMLASRGAAPLPDQPMAGMPVGGH